MRSSSISKFEKIGRFCELGKELKKIPKPDLILIDFDGVICRNSPDFVTRIFYEIISEVTPITLEFVTAYFRVVMSFPVSSSIDFLLSNLGVTPEEKKAILSRFKVAVTNSRSLFEVEKGFYDFLNVCKSLEIDYKILSLASDDRLSVLALPNDAFLPIEGRSKADVNTFREVFNISKAKSILYIDDSPLGIRTSKLSGMSSILMFNALFGFSEYFYFKEYVDFTVSSFSEIIKITESLYCETG